MAPTAAPAIGAFAKMSPKTDPPAVPVYTPPLMVTDGNAGPSMYLFDMLVTS